MNKIKIPEGWFFREFVCEGERIKFVYDDEFGEEHIYYEYQEHIPTYKELEERINKAIEYIKSTQLYGMRSGKTLYSKVMQETIKILRGEE